jgi:hypothetical protein
MSTVDYTGGTSVGSCIPYSGINNHYVLTNRIDFATTECTAADVIQCLDIPAGTLVTNVFVKVVTAEGATCTATVGDGDGANSFDASTDLNAAAGTVTYGIGGTDAYVTYGGKFYSDADTIDLTMGHNTDAAILDMYAVCIKIY